MRVVIFDRTCTRGRRGLSPVWAAGIRLYRALGRIDDAHGVASWDEAFTWLAALRRPIREIQYWGHGTWGSALVDRDAFDAESIRRRRDALGGLRDQLMPDALVWFRTCETFGAAAGHDFAARLADTLGARVAGHTHIIAFHQSGLHGLLPGMRPDWSLGEGLAAGTPEQPVRARWSAPWVRRTITAMTGAVPRAWFTRRLS